MVIFEATAKACKMLEESNFNNLINNLVSDSEYQMIIASKHEIWDLSCFIRLWHKDFIDCIHWATATINAEIFITEDKIMQKINSNPNFQNKFKSKFDLKLPQMMNYNTYMSF